MRMKFSFLHTFLMLAVGIAVTGTFAPPAVAEESMVKAPLGSGWIAGPILTVGETIPGTTGALNPSTAGAYTPPGVFDGIGAFPLDGEPDTVRVLVNHELLNFDGYAYDVSNGGGGTFSLTGSRVSYFDIDKTTRNIVDSGIAYYTIHDSTGAIATDKTFLANNFNGFSRFCSSQLVEAHQFGNGRGLENRIYFTGEEDSGSFNPVGGNMWALDPATGDLWQVSAMGRAAWENVTEIDTGTTTQVAFLMGDDTSPFDIDPGAADGDEAASLYLYVGEKDPGGDFLARNGLRGGKLYVFVADNGSGSPADFTGPGKLNGTWVEIDNDPTGNTPSEDGSSGFDEWGYPTWKRLWARAKVAGSFGFSRPEDITTNPKNGSQAAMASTGVDDYENGVDTFGTIYLIDVNFKKMTAQIQVLYDGDADPTRALRSPDNVDWADDGMIYVLEDKAEDISLNGENLFGGNAANPNEAGIVRINPKNGKVERIANIDRSVVLDASLGASEDDWDDAVDNDAGVVGAWETSGILDVSALFGAAPGTLFLFDVQAHGIDDQPGGSRIVDSDLKEGGQLLFLERTNDG